MNHREIGEELEYKAIRIETDSKSSYVHGTYIVLGINPGASYGLTWDGY